MEAKNLPYGRTLTTTILLHNLCSKCPPPISRTFISIHQSATKATVYGRAARKQMSDLIAWSLNVRSSLRMLWYRLFLFWWQTTACCWWQDKSEWRILSGSPPSRMNCRLQTFPASCFQQDGAPAHTAFLAQDWLNLNCPDFIEKDQWPQTLQIWTLWIIMCGC